MLQHQDSKDDARCVHRKALSYGRLHCPHCFIPCDRPATQNQREQSLRVTHTDSSTLLRAKDTAPVYCFILGPHLSESFPHTLFVRTWHTVLSVSNAHMKMLAAMEKDRGLQSSPHRCPPQNPHIDFICSATQQDHDLLNQMWKPNNWTDVCNPWLNWHVMSCIRKSNSEVLYPSQLSGVEQ